MILKPSRRGFIAGLASLIAAPAIVRVGSLMPVRQMIEPVLDASDIVWTVSSAPQYRGLAVYHSDFGLIAHSGPGITLNSGETFTFEWNAVGVATVT